MFEKVIVPLDGSEVAEVALPYAEEIAGRLGSQMILVSVREPQETRSQHLLDCYLEKMAGIAKAGAETYLSKSGTKEIKVETKILVGNPAEEIINFADKTDGAKIIMATHGESGINRWAIGSVADKITRATIRPVAVIRAKGGEPAVHAKIILTKILAPLDGSPESASSIPYVAELALRLKAAVTLLQVLKMNYITPSLENLDTLDATRKEAREYLAKLADSLKQRGIQANYEVRETRDDEADEINKYTQENYMDVVIMATHGRSGPKRWILGSVTNKVLRQGNTPIILVRTPGELKD